MQIRKKHLLFYFVKIYLLKAKGCWIDIISCKSYSSSDNPLHFKYVTCGLYQKILKPIYPPKSNFIKNGKFNERLYYQMYEPLHGKLRIEILNSRKVKK